MSEVLSLVVVFLNEEEKEKTLAKVLLKSGISSLITDPSDSDSDYDRRDCVTSNNKSL